MTAPLHDHVHDRESLPPPTVEEVSDDVFAYLQPDGTWGLNNCGFLVGRDAATLVDTCFTERRTRALLDTVSSTAGVPVRTLLNTHHHGDHTHGNWLVPGATIVGHDRCRDEILGDTGATLAFFAGVDWGHIEPAPPFVTFDDAVRLFVDDLRVEVFHPGIGHTTNDVVAWLPQRRVLFSGDLVFNGGTPFVVMGSVTGALASLARLRALEPTVIVPGHGPVCGVDAIDAQVAYLRFVQDVARAGFDDGLSPLDAARRTTLGRFEALTDRERLVGNLHRAYSELRGEPVGTTIDPTAYLDMIEYNDGRLPRCLA
jgi:cyclase